MRSVPASKLRPPTPRGGAVARPRLDAALDAARSSCRASVLVAPAGYGKTTAAAAWALGMGEAVAWLSLDPADASASADALASADAASLGAEAAVAGLLHASLRAVDAVPDAGPPTGLADLLAAVEASSWRGVVVVDDVHTLGHAGGEASGAALALATWVERAPEGVHTVLLARTVEHLPVPRWLVRGVAEVLEADRLRLEPHETRTILAASLPDLPPQLADRLHERVEGWAAGVHLAGRTLQGRADPADLIDRFTGTDRYVLAFLTEEVLLRLPDDLHDVALQLALEPRVCADLVNALTGRADGGALLERLEAQDAFLERLDVRDDAAPWFRFPGFFRDLLLHRLEALRPSVVPELAARSRAWWERRAEAESGALGRAAFAPGTAVRQPSGAPLRTPRGDATADGLTPRELEVLALLASGATTKAMARALELSPNTVKTHTKHLFEKLGVRTRTEAAARAHALGLAGPVRRDRPDGRSPVASASPTEVTRPGPPDG